MESHTMRVLIVFGSQFGTTEQLAREMGAAIAGLHEVEVVGAHVAEELTGHGVDLLIVGAPTQFKGHRLLVRDFLRSLEENGFPGVAAAAFDTRAHGDRSSTGSAAESIARLLAAAGCNVLAPAESFGVAGIRGPLDPGEVERARAWIGGLVRSVHPLRVPA
jgi:flavodoxin